MLSKIHSTHGGTAEPTFYTPTNNYPNICYSTQCLSGPRHYNTPCHKTYLLDVTTVLLHRVIIQVENRFPSTERV